MGKNIWWKLLLKWCYFCFPFWVTLVTSCLSENVVNLDVLTSPYTSDNEISNGASDTIHSCGGGNERVFQATVQPGKEIHIKQMHNSFDSTHELRYGGFCPGEHVVKCVDDPVIPSNFKEKKFISQNKHLT